MKTLTLAVICSIFAFRATDAGAQTPSAQEIITRMMTKYGDLDSMTVTGHVVSDVELTGAPESPGLPKKIPDTAFSIRMGRPQLYRVEWSQKVTDSFTQQGAVWSNGEGDFLSVSGQKRAIQGGLDVALGSATGVAGGVSLTLPPLFFHRTAYGLRSLNKLELLPEEKIGNADCYVVAGDYNGVRVIVWIAKDYSLKQKRMLLGSGTRIKELSDEEIKKLFAGTGQPATPAAIAKMKETMKSAQAMASKMKGSVTEIYDTFEANPSLKKDSFDYTPER